MEGLVTHHSAIPPYQKESPATPSGGGRCGWRTTAPGETPRPVAEGMDVESFPAHRG